MSDDGSGEDTMIGSTDVGATRVHGVLLADPGSAVVPEGGTITLEQWREQQEARP